MVLRKDKSILNTFLVFFMGYSIACIWLGFITKSFTTVYECINLALNLFQIISILLIFFKKNIGVYIFLIIRILDILLAVFIKTDINNIFTTILSNMLIVIPFYIFYYDKSLK